MNNKFDPTQGRHIPVPQELLDHAQIIQLEDKPVAREIISDMYKQLEYSKGNIADLLTRFEIHQEGFDQQMRVALEMQANQTAQYDDDKAIILEGVPLEGEAFELAKTLARKRSSVKLLMLMLVQTQTEIKEISLKLTTDLEKLNATHGGAVMAVCGVHTVVLHQDPNKPATTKKAVKA
jgi:hypothetical protein